MPACSVGAVDSPRKCFEVPPRDIPSTYLGWLKMVLLLLKMTPVIQFKVS